MWSWWHTTYFTKLHLPLLKLFNFKMKIGLEPEQLSLLATKLVNWDCCIPHPPKLQGVRTFLSASEISSASEI